MKGRYPRPSIVVRMILPKQLRKLFESESVDGRLRTFLGPICQIRYRKLKTEAILDIVSFDTLTSITAGEAIEETYVFHRIVIGSES